MGDDTSKSRNVGTMHAKDHMTVKHIQTELATAKPATRPQQDDAMRHLTTAHLSNALAEASRSQVSTEKPAQSAPSTAPAQKSGK